MGALTLNPEEIAILEEVIEGFLSDLRVEIRHTGEPRFRDELKRKEVFLEKLLQRLEASRVSA